jgi:hypothetical protein
MDAWHSDWGLLLVVCGRKDNDTHLILGLFSVPVSDEGLTTLAQLRARLIRWETLLALSQFSYNLGDNLAAEALVAPKVLPAPFPRSKLRREMAQLSRLVEARRDAGSGGGSAPVCTLCCAFCPFGELPFWTIRAKALPST